MSKGHTEVEGGCSGFWQVEPTRTMENGKVNNLQITFIRLKSLMEDLVKLKGKEPWTVICFHSSYLLQPVLERGTQEATTAPSCLVLCSGDSGHTQQLTLPSPSRISPRFTPVAYLVCFSQICSGFYCILLFSEQIFLFLGDTSQPLPLSGHPNKSNKAQKAVSQEFLNFMLI